MNPNYYDIIIIGSGLAGLFSAYNIKNTSHDTSFLVLEKYKKEWIGGRSSNEMFQGTPVVTGAGVGRKDKDKLLIKLMDEIGVKYTQYESNINFKLHSILFKNLHLMKTRHLFQSCLPKHTRHYAARIMMFLTQNLSTP